jgi:UDP-N-acetylglucosamine 2-epimerase (non-hydrolysing)
MTEIIHKYTSKIDESDVLNRLNLQSDKYFVVSLHREENLDIGDNFKTVCATLNAVAEKYDMPIIFSTHPRTQKRIESEDIKFNPLIMNMPAMGFFDYNKLQKNAYCVLSDSGTICEEGTIQHFPAVSVRTSQERPEGLDAGTLILGGIEQDSMFRAIDIAVGTNYDTSEIMVPNYKDINVSDKVLRIVQSYVPIINSRTWRK